MVLFSITGHPIALDNNAETIYSTMIGSVANGVADFFYVQSHKRRVLLKEGFKARFIDNPDLSTYN